MTSCKKDRTCTCSTTQVSFTKNGVPQPVSNDKTTSVRQAKTTKKDSGCNGGEQTSTTSDTYAGKTTTRVRVSKADCKLN